MEILSHAEFLQKLNGVKVVLAGENVVLTSSRGQVEGNLSFTEGLKDLIGYELVAYGMFDRDDLISSAEMIHANFPRGFALEIPAQFIKDLELDIPDAPYRQYMLDESSLVDDKLVVSEEPLWTGDGGYSILDEAEMNAQLELAYKERAEVNSKKVEKIHKQCREEIEQLGYSVMSVYDPEGVEENFCYTVGLTKKGLPEFVISAAFDLDNLATCADHLAGITLAEGFALRKIENVLTLEDDTKCDIRVVEVDPVYAVDKYMRQAPGILKQAVTRVAWIQISDSQKRFPGDEGFENKFRQPQISTVVAS